MHNDSVRRLNIYLAGPLFSEAERNFNIRLKRLLERYIDVYLPQEDGGLLIEMISREMPVELAKRAVFNTDMRALRNCDAFVIILDGRTVDEGAAFELGCAHILGKPCYGLKTGPRQLLQCGDNPMIHGALEVVFSDVAQLVSWAESFAKEGSPLFAAASTEDR
jgi:nucleoside 2-deoxyribosyltransferase